MKKTLFLVTFLFSTLSYNANAQTQAEMNETAFKSYQKVDTELNKVYKHLLKVLEEDEIKMLVKAQKDWIKFRDSHCEFEAHEYEGGSIQPLIRLTCLEVQTKKRIEDLQSILKNREN
ncbi:lysozyme inhibitor LprI family protein [Flavobacterium sp.]|uniref:lysozyme inhibitor LprI family protein n=1 Tax=Flavobacterium sp. TaxID=239 RepID=UPI0025B8871E|nr:lysozyme inhibitor LprI family protein [Flavobacterium sp.]